MSSHERQDQILADRISSRHAVVGIVGMGYVGVPLAMAFRRAGFPVIAFDVDAGRVDALNNGRNYIRHLDSAGNLVRTPGLFEATTEHSKAADADVLLLCLPTPLTRNREPDLSYVVDSAERLLPYLRAGQLVVLESTTYPGTTDELLAPILRRSGLGTGAELFIAYSPEREDPGNPSRSTAQIPKLVGGVDPPSLRLAAMLYRAIVPEVIEVSSTRTAEMAKLLENIYRSVNIALVNEMKVLAHRMGIDIWEVIKAASTKPFGFQAFYPGPGLGGHCIPIDPFYLSWKAREYEVPTRFIELAGEVNRQMPAYVVARVAEALNDAGKCVRGSRILLLGVAYKPDVDDCRESPAVKIAELLVSMGSEVVFHDPYVQSFPGEASAAIRISPAWVDLTADELAAAACTVIVTNHSNIDYQFVVDNASLVVDTRNATDGLSWGRGTVVNA